MAMTPIYDYVAPWSWTASNGSASQTQVRNAYSAITTEGPTTQFSYVVWNDLVDKINAMRATSGRAWNMRHSTFANTKMSASANLMSYMFNSAITNINYPYLTWWLDEDIKGYLGREFMQGVAAYGKNADAVYGKYFIELMQALNIILGVYNGNIDRREMRGHTGIAHSVNGYAVARPSLPVSWNNKASGIFVPTFDRVAPRPLAVSNTTPMTFRVLLNMVEGGLSAIELNIRMFTTQPLKSFHSAPFRVSISSTTAGTYNLAYQQPRYLSVDALVATLKDTSTLVDLPSLPASAINTFSHICTASEIAILQGMNIRNTLVERTKLSASMGTVYAENFDTLVTEFSIETSATLESEAQVTFSWRTGLTGIQKASPIALPSGNVPIEQIKSVSTVVGNMEGCIAQNFSNAFDFVSTIKGSFNVGTSAVVGPIRDAYQLLLKASLDANRGTEFTGHVSIKGAQSAEFSAYAMAAVISANVAFKHTVTLPEPTFKDYVEFFASTKNASIQTLAMELSSNMVYFEGSDTSSFVQYLTGDILPSFGLGKVLVKSAYTVSGLLDTEGSTWVYPIQTGITVYIQQAYHIAHEEKLLRLEQQSMSNKETIEAVSDVDGAMEITTGIENPNNVTTLVLVSELDFVKGFWRYPERRFGGLLIKQAWNAVQHENNLEVK